jgi:hypothetical protein
MKCPRCGSEKKHSKNGFTPAGSRRLKCKSCDYQWALTVDDTDIIDWVKINLEEHGEGYVRVAYTAFVTDLGPVCTPEEYLELLRTVLYSDQERKRPIESHEVKTITDALDFHQVDTSKFDITKASVTTWGSEANPNKRVKLDFDRKKSPTPEEFAEEFRKAVEEFTPPMMPLISRPSGVYLLEMNIPDAHFGQLSWREETGKGDWDVKIAAEAYLSTVSRMLDWARSRPVEKILFPIGHDFFNSDTKTNTTTAGTPMTEDTRWMKTFSLGWKLVRDAVILASQVAPVEVVCIRGNHDDQRAFYMTEILSSWFKDNPSVMVDNSPRVYKMKEYGLNLIGLTHGNNCKIEKLPSLMASDWPEEWGRTRFREWHIGHLHTDLVKEFPGCKVVVVPSIVSPSEWSIAMGMRSQRAARAFLWHKEYGRTETFDYTPLP